MKTPARNRVSAIAAMAIVATVLVASVSARIIIDVGDDCTLSGQTDIRIPLYINNDTPDTIQAFQLWLAIDHPDLLRFQTDSAATAGTLLEGHNYGLNSLSGDNIDLLISVGELTQPAILPGESGVAMYIMADALSVPLIPEPDNTTRIFVHAEMPDHFSFSDPWGTSLLTSSCEVIDTSYFICTQWGGDECLAWQQVSVPPADSVIIDTIMTYCLDTTRFSVFDGAVTVTHCGDVNGTGAIDIGDLAALIGWLFPPPSEQPDLPCMAAANFDGITGPGGLLDISDLTHFVAYLFGDGPPPIC